MWTAPNALWTYVQVLNWYWYWYCKCYRRCNRNWFKSWDWHWYCYWYWHWFCLFLVEWYMKCMCVCVLVCTCNVPEYLVLCFSWKIHARYIWCLPTVQRRNISHNGRFQSNEKGKGGRRADFFTQNKCTLEAGISRHCLLQVLWRQKRQSKWSIYWNIARIARYATWWPNFQQMYVD